MVALEVPPAVVRAFSGASDREGPNRVSLPLVRLGVEVLAWTI